MKTKQTDLYADDIRVKPIAATRINTTVLAPIACRVCGAMFRPHTPKTVVCMRDHGALDLAAMKEDQ
jgi:hypothetical protein